MTRHVLLIDDDDDIRFVATTALVAVAGWRVTPATSGPEGLEAARRERPDAVLLDMMMPGMDGPATLAAFRADEVLGDVPVVILSAKAGRSETDELARLGADGVLAKPFDPLNLHRCIGEVLGWDVV